MFPCGKVSTRASIMGVTIAHVQKNTSCYFWPPHIFTTETRRTLRRFQVVACVKFRSRAKTRNPNSDIFMPSVPPWLLFGNRRLKSALQADAPAAREQCQRAQRRQRNATRLRDDGREQETHIAT